MNDAIAAQPGSATNPLLSGRNLKKTYRMGQQPLTVLEGISLDVFTGDFLALRGASGAGKSTLLHLLGGLDRPDAGEVWFEGKDLSVLSARELARLRNGRVGFIFQAYHLFPELDALENVCLPARMARRSLDDAITTGRELLRRVGLDNRLDHRPTELSGGEQQRVAIARALVNHPALLLADEPTGNLDSHTGDAIIELLKELRQEKSLTVIVATHDVRVADCAPKQLVLEDGRLVESGHMASE
jgi:ABC-type lipoprotein export system ATPase subunit